MKRPIENWSSKKKKQRSKLLSRRLHKGIRRFRIRRMRILRKIQLRSVYLSLMILRKRESLPRIRVLLVLGSS